MQDFDGNGSVETALLGAEYPAGSAAAKQFAELIGGKLGTELIDIGRSTDRSKAAEGGMVDRAEMFDGRGDEAPWTKAAGRGRLREAQPALGAGLDGC